MLTYKVLHPGALLYYLKQILLLCRHAGRIRFARLRVYIANGADIIVHSSARVVFRGIAHVSSQFKMEVFPGASVTFGERLFINRGVSIVARYGVDIGQDCMIGEYVTVYDHNHVFDQEYVPFNQQGYRGAKVMIGNNVWIGSHVFIGKGVAIGDNVVIGAGCIIAVDIPSNMIVRQKRGLILSRIRYKESK